MAAAVLAVGQDRRAAGDGGGAARGVARVHPVAHQLAQQLDVGGLGAAGAGGGELEVGLCELDVLDGLAVDDVLLEVLVLHGHLVEVHLLALHLLEGGHHQGVGGLVVLVGRAGSQAHAAAQAVIGRDLHAEEVAGRVLAQALGGHRLKGGGHLGLLLLGQQHRTDGRVGAAHGAAVALNAALRVPLGHLGGDTALGESGGAVLPRAVQHAVLLEHGHGQLVALLAVHGQHDVADEGRDALGLRHRGIGGVGPALGDLHLHCGGNARVHRGVVLVHDGLACLLEVGVVVVLLHVLHGHVQRNDLGQGEEGRLQDAVDPLLAKAHLHGQLGRVNDVELGVLPGQIPLHLAGQARIQLLRAPGAVEQEGAALLQVLGGVVLVDVGGCVDRHEVRRGHQVRGPNGLVAEAQVALGQAAGLHGVVGEIRLGILVRHQADGGDGVLVGAHGAVAAQAPDLAGHLAGMGQLHLLIVQGGVGHVVVDADGEAVLGIFLLEVIVHRDELARRGVLGAEAVPAAHHADVAAARLVQGGHHVQVHRLAHGARLLGPVQHGDALAGGGDGRREVLHGEGTVQVDLHHAYLAALLVQVVHRLLHGLGARAHDDDDFFGVGGAVVVEELIVPAGQLADLVHVVLHGIRQGGGLLVGALLALEVHVRVDVVAPVGGVLRVQGLTAESLQRIIIHQFPQILIVQRLDPLHLVGGAEAVEAVHERVLAADGAQVRHSAQVHGLLGGRGHQHAVAGHPAGHEVRVVAEDGVVVAGHHTGRDVHDAGQELPAHGVHRRDHQHQALGGRERRGQGAGLQRAVAGTRGARLRLHLDHVHRGPEQVLPALGGPLVHLLRHGRRRRDGIDRRHLRERVRHMRRRRVAVHDDIVLFHRDTHLL